MRGRAGFVLLACVTAAAIAGSARFVWGRAGLWLDVLFLVAVAGALATLLVIAIRLLHRWAEHHEHQRNGRGRE